ncbi:MAG: hypothetical protein B6D63_02095 [Candidatus Latescibacteria bacterium 4484_7]|nr:MAG: hypothetical protein B6D63_02095 [Candidatus Latescibacteria bacterium 4484_7]
MRSLSKVSLGLFVVSIILIVFSSVSSALPNLVIQKDWITKVTNSNENTTRVTVTVKNTGDQTAGAFTLRLGVSNSSSSGYSDFSIKGIAPNGRIIREYLASGIYDCVWGNADIANDVSESNENDNAASVNNWHLILPPGGTSTIDIGIANPGIDSERAILTVDAPSGWLVTVDPSVVNLQSEGLEAATVTFQVPSGFDSTATVVVYQEFEDGTPGVFDFDFYFESTVGAENESWGAIKSLFK